MAVKPIYQTTNKRQHKRTLRVLDSQQVARLCGVR